MDESLALYGRFAIVMAAFNGIAHLPQQTDSIMAQRRVNTHLFVSLDRSKDASFAWLSEETQRNASITLLPYGASFGAAAPNFFRLIRDVNLDNFDYLAFADQDDIWGLDKLARAHECMQAHGADGYSSNVTAFWDSGRTLLVDKAQPQRQWDHLFEAAGPGCTYVMTRRLALALQDCARAQAATLSEVGYHDWFTYAFARVHGFTWFIDPQPHLLYRQHASNQVGVNSGLGPFIRRARKVFSGDAFQQARLIARAAGLPADHPVQLRLGQGRWGALRLALSAHHCRRKLLERAYFLFSCLLCAVTGLGTKASK